MICDTWRKKTTQNWVTATKCKSSPSVRPPHINSFIALPQTQTRVDSSACKYHTLVPELPLHFVCIICGVIVTYHARYPPFRAAGARLGLNEMQHLQALSCHRSKWLCWQPAVYQHLGTGNQFSNAVSVGPLLRQRWSSQWPATHRPVTWSCTTASLPDGQL